jgi:hypothetical protein
VKIKKHFEKNKADDHHSQWIAAFFDRWKRTKKVPPSHAIFFGVGMFTVVRPVEQRQAATPTFSPTGKKYVVPESRSLC